jgi:hypothetical protein
LKDTELRLISELLKNSRRSDRELSRALGISQPTVSRMSARGLIYGYYDDHLTRLQAILLLQKLNKFGPVEGFKRTQSHFGKSTKVCRIGR